MNVKGIIIILLIFGCVTDTASAIGYFAPINEYGCTSSLSPNNVNGCHDVPHTFAFSHYGMPNVYADGSLYIELPIYVSNVENYTIHIKPNGNVNHFKVYETDFLNLSNLTYNNHPTYTKYLGQITSPNYETTFYNMSSKYIVLYVEGTSFSGYTGGFVQLSPLYYEFYITYEDNLIEYPPGEKYLKFEEYFNNNDHGNFSKCENSITDHALIDDNRCTTKHDELDIQTSFVPPALINYTAIVSADYDFGFIIDYLESNYYDAIYIYFWKNNNEYIYEVEIYNPNSGSVYYDYNLNLLNYTNPINIGHQIIGNTLYLFINNPLISSH